MIVKWKDLEESAKIVRYDMHSNHRVWCALNRCICRLDITLTHKLLYAWHVHVLNMAPSQAPAMKMVTAPVRMELWVKSVIRVPLATGDCLLVAAMVSPQVF